MESFDISKHLPPRKRLLAELKRENYEFDFLPPVPSVSGDLGARLRDVVNSPSSTPKKIIEVAQSVASAAAEIAVAARNNAIEKAAAATKAKTAAKNALLFLDSITVSRTPREGCLARNKVRKREVPIKLLYKTIHAAGNPETDEELARKLHRANPETDEELARKLHRAMNSSPRISNHKEKNTKNFGKEVLYNGDFCVQNSHDLLDDGVRMSRECYEFLNELEGKNADCSKDNDLVGGEENRYSIEKRQNEARFRSLAGGKKVRIRQKKLPLSRCNFRDQAEVNKPSLPMNGHSFTKEAKLDSSEGNMSRDDAELSHDGGMSTKITSAWKCKKIRASQCSSDSKILRALC